MWLEDQKKTRVGGAEDTDVDVTEGDPGRG